MFNISNDNCVNITIYAILIILFLIIIRKFSSQEDYLDVQNTHFKDYKPKNLNVKNKIYFRNKDHSDDTDVYTLQKINNNGINSLRLTINDNPDETFEIWGNSCLGPGGCKGSGEKAHSFRADGTVYHSKICLKKNNGKHYCIDGDDLDKLRIKKLYKNARNDCGYPHMKRGFYDDGWGFCRWVGWGDNFACEKDDGTYVNWAQNHINPNTHKSIPYRVGTYSPSWNC